jgi:LysM repeat protein
MLRRRKAAHVKSKLRNQVLRIAAFHPVMPALWGIASMLGVTVNVLAVANKIVKPDFIYPGQVLILPITYTIQPGDTLWSIANMFKTNVCKLVELNNIKDGFDFIP